MCHSWLLTINRHSKYHLCRVKLVPLGFLLKSFEGARISSSYRGLSSTKVLINKFILIELL